MAEEIEEAYQSKQSEVEVIDDIDEETVSDEPVIQSELAEQTETQEQPEQDVETADEMRDSEQESENLAPEQGAAVSPMYRRYLEAQQLNAKAIVLFRVGDFYEVMGENARTVAEEVGLTLTSRDVGLSERVPMCGFPYFAADAYMEKILETHGVILAEDGKEPRHILSHAEALEQKDTAEKKSVHDDSETEELLELFGEENDEQSDIARYAHGGAVLAEVCERAIFGYLERAVHVKDGRKPHRLRFSKPVCEQEQRRGKRADAAYLPFYRTGSYQRAGEEQGRGKPAYAHHRGRGAPLHRPEVPDCARLLLFDVKAYPQV